MRYVLLLAVVLFASCGVARRIAAGDPNDMCPDVEEDRDGFEDQDGCPDPDNDQDGTLDVTDRCPNEPEDRDGFQDEDGCPDVDNDGDGIPDAVDECPNDPETYNEIDDADGCPDHARVVIQPHPPHRTTERIYFDVDSIDLKETQYALLEEVAAVMKSNPQVKKVLVIGHADATTDTKDPQTLSDQRADVVRDFLVSKGVEKERLVVEGRAASEPLNPPGDERNRRVEFHIQKMDP